MTLQFFDTNGNFNRESITQNEETEFWAEVDTQWENFSPNSHIVAIYWLSVAASETHGNYDVQTIVWRCLGIDIEGQ